MRVRSALIVAGIVCGASLLGGCRGKQDQRYVLDMAPTTGVLAVDVENFRGPVHVKVEPGRETVRVTGTVRVAGLGDYERRERLFSAVDVEADLEEVAGRGVLRVRSTSSREEFDDHDVDLTILTPRCDGVRIMSRGGDVLVYDARGSIDIRNHEGAIEVRTSHPITDPVVLTTVDGSIFYQLPEGSAGRVDLETLRGEVSYKDKVSATTSQSQAERASYTGVLNDGANSVVARTNQGNIYMWIMDEPLAYRRTFRTWKPDARDGWFLHGKRRHTRNLPDDHPEVTGESPRAQSWRQYYEGR